MEFNVENINKEIPVQKRLYEVTFYTNNCAFKDFFIAKDWNEAVLKGKLIHPWYDMIECLPYENVYD